MQFIFWLFLLFVSVVLYSYERLSNQQAGGLVAVCGNNDTLVPFYNENVKNTDNYRLT